MAILPGKRLGPYEILSAIGAGGMGEVYRAKDTRLDRIVAIKVLPPHLADSSELKERFEREARTIASLNHPHICTLHDIGHQDGTDFLVMEYLEGETLAQRLVKGPLPLDQVLQYAIEIADALDKAHRKGVTHRDLKPGNIMLTKSGTKLLDFGLAKLKQEVARASVQLSQLPTAKDPLTAQGTIVGTLQYMAPEQLEGKEVDARTDIFAFGAVVYEMATGKRAFEGKSQASVISAIMSSDPLPMSSLQPMTPPALDRIVRRCLAKEPDERWQSANDLTNELKWIAGSGSQAGVVVSVPASRKFSQSLAWSIAGVCLLLALVLGAALLLRTEKPALVSQATLLPPKDHNFSGSHFAISPDGKRIAFLASDSSSVNGMLWVRSLDSTTAQPLAGTDAAAAPFWSPDSGSIGFFAGNSLKKIDVGGGPVINLAAIGQVNPQGATWSTDGTIVFTRGTLGDGLYQVASNGGPVTSLTHYDKNRGEGSHRWPFFLPDGRHLLFEVGLGYGTVPEIRVLDVKTKKQSVLLPADSNAQYANGYLLCIQQGNLMAQPFDPASLKLSGASFPVAQQVPFNTNSGKGAFSSSPSGLLAFQSGEATNQLVWYSRDGKETGQVGSPGQYDAVSFSPDGTKVATSLLDAQTRKRDIWVFELARRIATRVTVDGIAAQWPVWSSDSKLVYWGVERGAGIYAKSPSGLGGSEQVEQVAHGATGAVAPNSISPDGKFLVYSMSANSARQRLWIHAFGSEKPNTQDTPLLRTNSQEGDAQFSSDGHWLAYTSEETGKEEIYVVPFPSLSSKLQISTAGGSQPRWQREGKEIYYIAPDGKMMAVAVEASGDSFKADSPKALFQTRSVAVTHTDHQYDVTADGQRFLINSSEQSSQPITLYANWATALKAK